MDVKMFSQRTIYLSKIIYSFEQISGYVPVVKLKMHKNAFVAKSVPTPHGESNPSH